MIRHWCVIGDPCSLVEDMPVRNIVVLEASPNLFSGLIKTRWRVFLSAGHLGIVTKFSNRGLFMSVRRRQRWGFSEYLPKLAGGIVQIGSAWCLHACISDGRRKVRVISSDIILLTTFLCRWNNGQIGISSWLTLGKQKLHFFVLVNEQTTQSDDLYLDNNKNNFSHEIKTLGLHFTKHLS